MYSQYGGGRNEELNNRFSIILLAGVTVILLPPQSKHFTAISNLINKYTIDPTYLFFLSTNFLSLYVSIVQ